MMTHYCRRPLLSARFGLSFPQFITPPGVSYLTIEEAHPST
jgi:hypothetical protein